MESVSGPPDLGDLTAEEANRIIHSHRKVRYGTACWPCRQRKVKCDNKHPCQNCCKRDHPQLCSYKPNRPSASKQIATGNEIGQIKKRPYSPDDGTSQSDGAQNEVWPRASDQTEPTDRYVGQNSIPALLRDQPSPMDAKNTLEPIWGLDTSAPFPLMSTYNLDRMTLEISQQLPPDREVIKLFKTYKEVAHPFWGFVMDIDGFESRLMLHLESRAKGSGKSATASKPVTASWLAILFCVLAVGSQYHDTPYHIRTKSSQKYMQIAFHFLRLGNFLLRPNLESIQALLMTSFALLNDMKAEASWAIIALTCRLAQSLGLHRPTAQTSRESSSSESSRDHMRRRLWWTVQWHDSLTSLAFDRPNMANIQCCPIPTSLNADQGLSYLETMYHLCEFIGKKLNPDATSNITYTMIANNCQDVESLWQNVHQQLRDKEALRTAVDRLQHYALRLHTSFVISVCCRPALRSDCTRLSTEEKKAIVEKCSINLIQTVRMFLCMHNISAIPTRSWAFTYHGLSSAILLGIISGTKNDPEVRRLQGELIHALSATAAKDEPNPSSDHIKKSDRDIELSGPLSRALAALKNIYDKGSWVSSGPGSEILSGSRSPTSASRNSHDANAPVDDYSRNVYDQASMAMAQPVGISSIADITQPDDSNSYISPMELYDSIFWESPDPFQTGYDMNLDFTTQPMPGEQSQQHFYI